MSQIKKINKYYFSVEGETECWYLEHLAKLINETPNAALNVSFDIKVEKNPLKRAKSLVITGKTEIWHLSDYESDEPEHVKGFTDTMKNLKAVSKLGKQITYKFGYSNFAFDLWIVLHKADCNRSYIHREQYLEPINKAYGENFSRLKEYKREENFKRCLKQIQLSDVLDAITRSKTIMKRNEENGYTLHEYMGYKYYKENPSLTVWEVVEQIISDCGAY